jgi:hydrogenase/urease accessory protein HupE
MIQRLVSAVFLYSLSLFASADEIRPGYLELTETRENIFSVVWKVPAKNNKKLGLQAWLPDNCVDITQANAQFVNGAYIQRWITDCKLGLFNQSIQIKGLSSTVTDVLLRLEFLDGTSRSVLLTPAEDRYLVPEIASSLQVVRTYTWLGITHILGGLDHLLFVFALLLIVRQVRQLLWTITAFTLAHSITLAGATLGLVHVPQKPVEAVIALSILFLAVEIVHGKRGRPGAAARWPWLVAFIFGLLHGFGFAGALAEVGLPQQAIPLALIFFNVGVELGQLLFITVALGLGWLLHQFKHPKLMNYAETVVLYGIGSLSAFWLIERVAAF